MRLDRVAVLRWPRHPGREVGDIALTLRILQDLGTILGDMALDAQIDDLAALEACLAPLPAWQGAPVELDDGDLVRVIDRRQGGAVAPGLAAGLALAGVLFRTCPMGILGGWKAAVSAVHACLGHQQFDDEQQHGHHGARRRGDMRIVLKQPLGIVDGCLDIDLSQRTLPLKR